MIFAALVFIGGVLCIISDEVLERVKEWKGK